MRYHLFIDGVKIEHVAAVRLNRDGTVGVIDEGIILYSRGTLQTDDDGLNVNIRLYSADRITDPTRNPEPVMAVGPKEYKDGS